MNDSDSNFETIQYLRIPLKRIGAVIGVKGSIRISIEEKTDAKISIDSDTGEVEIKPKSENSDPVKFLKAKDIVRAIGRGFTSEKALLLADDNYYLEVIRLKSLVGNNPQRLKRVRSRVIGSGGKTRNSIEQLTKTSLVVSGATVSLIGELNRVQVAADAITKLIQGAKVETILISLEDKKRDLEKSEEKLWKSEDDEKTLDELFPPEKPQEEDDIFADLE